MGGTHFVELGFQLTHIPLHFLYGCSVEIDNKTTIEDKCNRGPIRSTSPSLMGTN